MYYCGVCKSIGRNFGQPARFGLINESAILALLLDLSSSTINLASILKKNCIAHPFKKSNFVTKNDCVDYAAAINVILMYFKLEDNKTDDRSLLAAGGELTIKRGFKKAVKKCPIVSDSIFINLKTLSKLEKAACSCIDEAAEPFAAMMRDVFKWKDCDIFCSNPNKLELLGNMGYNVGKWIYLIDALADAEKDKKSGSYNVFLKKYSDVDSIDKQNIAFILNMCLAKLAEAWEELKLILESENDIENIRYVNGIGVIDNLIYIGMRHITEVKAGIKDESV